ncbi:MAG: JAB domain-containing protein [Gemmatimonadales bacterium]|nr:JAB domain-containing protein [Gemmatimonadales bacterium]
MEDSTTPKVESGTFPNVPTWSVRLVRDRVAPFRTKARQLPRGSPPTGFSCAADIYEYVKAYFQGLSHEEMWVLVSDVKNQVRGVAMVSRGILDASLVHPREVFRIALLAGPSATVVLVHNHPSGDPEPSPEDMQLTKKMTESGTLLGIPVLDHLIVGARGFISFSERGWL